jgi:hypothetical protein
MLLLIITLHNVHKPQKSPGDLSHGAWLEFKFSTLPCRVVAMPQQATG